MQGHDLTDLKLVRTLDDSYTLYLPSLDEHYHSVKGAIEESQHVFVNAGFRACEKVNPLILEVGFGTGLNLILTIEEAITSSRSFRYHTVEKYPLGPGITGKLAKAYENNETRSRLFLSVHDARWNKPFELFPGIEIVKTESDLADLQLENIYDLVYFDAFAPSKDPVMWSDEILEKVLASIVKGGLFVTYSATGRLKRTLKSNGFVVETLKGATGKREMVRGIKKS